jgi:hypothetical protein
MYTKDFGFTTQMRYVNYAVQVGTWWHLFLSFAIAVTAAGVAYQTSEYRGRTWEWWLLIGQSGCMVVPVLTQWIMTNNWSGWRYMVHLAGCVGFASWHGIFIVAHVFKWIDCQDEEMCIGQAPLGNPWYGSSEDGSADIWFLVNFFAVGVSFSMCVLCGLYNFWLRNKIELRLALAMASSRRATNPNALSLESGPYGSGREYALGNQLSGNSSFADADGYSPIFAQLLEPAAGSQEIVPIGDSIDVDPRQGTYWLENRLELTAMYVAPQSVDFVRMALQTAGDNNLQLVRGPSLEDAGFTWPTWLSTPHIGVVLPSSAEPLLSIAAAAADTGMSRRSSTFAARPAASAAISSHLGGAADL